MHRAALAPLMGFMLMAPSAQALTVLDENFDDVITLGNISNSGAPAVCVNSNCSSIRAGLPTGTLGNSTTGAAPAGASTAPNDSNIRRGDNTLNTSTGTNGFSSFFGAGSTNGFLVLGDQSGVLGGAPDGGLSFTRLPFVLASHVDALTVAFDWAFNGIDSVVTAGVDDIFSARLVNSSGAVLQTLLTRSSGTVAGFGNGAFNTSWAPVGGLSAANYAIEFTLSEQAATGTQSALGIDNVVVTSVPEPAALALVLTGLLAVSASTVARKKR